MRLAHPGVLVSEWIDAVTLWDAPDPDQAAARLVRFAFGAATAGIMHSGLTPDDVLVLPDGGLAVLDCGAWCEVDRDRLSLFVVAFEAFLARDRNSFAAALEQLGWLPRSRGAASLELIQQALGPLSEPGPARLDRAAVLAAGDRSRQHSDAIAPVLLAGALSPQDLWLARGVAQLFGTIARVGATGDWSGLIGEALHDGWSAPLT